MVMGADSCLFECANPNQQLSRPMTSTSPGAAVDDLGKRLHAALLSSRPTGSFRPTPPPRLLHHILGRPRAYPARARGERFPTPIVLPTTLDATSPCCSGHSSHN